MYRRYYTISVVYVFYTFCYVYALCVSIKIYIYLYTVQCKDRPIVRLEMLIWFTEFNGNLS